MPKSRINARLRPQRKQRRTTRDLNFGGRFDLATVDFFAMLNGLLLIFSLSGVMILPVSLALVYFGPKAVGLNET